MIACIAIAAIVRVVGSHYSDDPECLRKQMKIAPFETEHFFARYEFNTPYQLCNSDCESISIAELLNLAGDSLEELGRQRLVYTQSQGQPELREAIAASYRSVSPDHALVLGTPVEGIYLAARSLLEPGDEVVVLTPAYDALINLFEHVAGAERVKRWEFRATDAEWSLELDDLRALLTPATRLLVVNFPHNPTGYLPSPEWQQELVDLVQEWGLWLFSDEMYFGLVHAGTPPIPSMADVSNRALVLSGLSKTHGLPGLRCGWLVVPDESLRNNIMNWKFYTSICPPVTTEYLARAALRAGDLLKQRNIDRIAGNMATAEAFFERWHGLFAWRRPQAGSTALVGFDVPSVNTLSRQLASEEGLLIQSAVMLGSDDQHMRIGLGRADFESCLQRFERWLEQSPLAG
jgi:aspartate/methionine/tyrosine aminotransferase